jgi:uncharacterized SAM-binding protein YcdF (DUF218 family)
MKRRTLRRGLWLLLAIVFAYATFNGVVADRIWRYAAVRDEIAADAAVVLGATVWGDGPSPVFAARIDHAVSLYENGTVRSLILTGGTCESGAKAESEVARKYAIARGIPASAIVIDTVSRSTYENLAEAKRIAQSLRLSTLLIVTDPLHERRAMTIASDLSLAAHPAPTPTTRYRSWTSRLIFLARETASLSSYLIARTFAAR